MRKLCVALAAVLVLQFPTVAMALSCSAEHARYGQAGRTGVTATLVLAGSASTAASDLFFIVRSKSHAYWFRFQQANGYGSISLEPVRDPAGAKVEERQPVDLPSDMPEIRFIPYRADMTEIADAPRSGGRPPRLIVLPDLGAALWYDASALGGPKERETMSRSAFVLSGCDRKTGTGKARR